MTISKQKIKSYLEKIDPLRFKDSENILEIKKLGSGESNVNFLLKTNKNKYLMRIDLVADKKRFKKEFSTLKGLSKYPLAQKPLFIDTSKKYFKENIMILSYLEGKSLGDLNKRIYLPEYKKLAIKLAQLHKLRPKFADDAYSFEERRDTRNKIINRLRKELIRLKAHELIELTDIYKKELKERSRKYKPKITFCHGDLCQGNILFYKKDFFLIDWELAGLLDPAIEISYHLYEIPYSPKQREEFVKVYLQHRKDPTLKERMQFTNFFVATAGYLEILQACFNVANQKGHKDYLAVADFDEYWDWGNYYLKFVIELNLFDNVFEKELKNELAKLYKTLKRRVK